MITQKELKELVNYNAKTGVFTWAKGRPGASKGSVCGGINKGNGYACVMILGVAHAAHRLAFLYVNGFMPTGEIDHVNHIKTDNRIENLRSCSRKENSMNRSLFTSNKTGITGVSFYENKSKWYSYIQVNKKSISLGWHSTLFDAAAARIKSNLKYGFHINHGKQPI